MLEAFVSYVSFWKPAFIVIFISFDVIGFSIKHFNNSSK